MVLTKGGIEYDLPDIGTKLYHAEYCSDIKAYKVRPYTVERVLIAAHIEVEVVRDDANEPPIRVTFGDYFHDEFLTELSCAAEVAKNKTAYESMINKDVCDSSAQIFIDGFSIADEFCDIDISF